MLFVCYFAIMDFHVYRFFLFYWFNCTRMQNKQMFNKKSIKFSNKKISVRNQSETFRFYRNTQSLSFFIIITIMLTYTHTFIFRFVCFYCCYCCSFFFHVSFFYFFRMYQSKYELFKAMIKKIIYLK